MSDEFADPRPRHSGQVEQGDAPVPEVVRREGRDAGSGAGAGERRSELLRRERFEHAAVGVAIVPRAELEHELEQEGRRLDPPRPAGLTHGRGDAPASAGLVDVALGQPLELADAHPGRVEHERRQAVAGREQPRRRLDALDRCELERDQVRAEP